MNDTHPLASTIVNLRIKVEERFKHDSSGHDFLHIERVMSSAKQLALQEGANVEITELIALLHDVEDHKLIQPGEEGMVKRWLEEENVGQKLIERTVRAIDEISFKGAKVDTPTSTLEAACVQDADRLDALGAIGIARTFAYGGSKGNPMYAKDYQPVQHGSFEKYKNHKGNTIGHFYEKLLLLKDRMQTKSGREMSQQRHNFMLAFLKQWDAELGL